MLSTWQTSIRMKFFSEYSYWAKFSVFFLIIVVSFIVLFAPQFLWTFHEHRVEDFVTTEENTAATHKTTLPNHNPQDKWLVRELSSKLMPPARKGHVSMHDLPFPSKLIEELRALTDFKKSGYFIEVGSGDKDFFSDTLFLELRMGWTGLLVEPDPINMKLFRRNSWIAPACMSLNNSAYEFHYQPYISLHGHKLRDTLSQPHKVICYPFYTFWLALNRPVIDYFALDVGGGELEILETIPFDKVDIKIVHVDFTKARDGFMGVVSLMQRSGYKVVSQVLPHYLFFIKKEYNQHYNEI